jgi:hypothetical protein
MSGEGAFSNDLAMRLREIGVHITNSHGNFSLIPIAYSVPISALRQNFRDKKYIQTINDYG